MAFTNSIPLNNGYQLPPEAIITLVDAPLAPAIRLSPNRKWLLLLERPNLPSISSIAQDELRLAGLRINPTTNGPSRSNYYTYIRLKSVYEDKVYEIKGLENVGHIENVSWAPDSQKIVFTNTLTDGIELWMIDVASAEAKPLTTAIIRDTIGIPYQWFSDSSYLLIRRIPKGQTPLPSLPTVVFTPIIQSNEGARKPSRTYQDLLKNAHDERQFEYYTESELCLLNITTNEQQKFTEPGIFGSISSSPDGNYLLISRIKRPFSYTVPYTLFPREVLLYERSGKFIRTLEDIQEPVHLPQGFGAVRKGKRHFQWRSDQPAMLYWVQALDDGDPKVEVDYRDQLCCLPAPFVGEPKQCIKFKLRYGDISWGCDKFAIAYEWRWKDRTICLSAWNPTTGGSKRLLFKYSWEDAYNLPGQFELTYNEYGRLVLMHQGDKQTLFLKGQGASPEGSRPFIDSFHVENKQSERLWQSVEPNYEVPISIVDPEKGLVLTTRESNQAPPNLFLHQFNKLAEPQQLTQFESPYKFFKAVKKELIQYKRADGVELSGTLYLPPNYNPEKDGPLPVLMWAYPREYKSKDTASQLKNSPHEFIRISWSSPLYLVTQGYAVFNNFSMPIVGEGEAEPNETFIEQLRSSAKAAVDTLVNRGIADPKRIAVGGHSYGAFMTANLLAHTNLFAAGIARSGAYNRTLTPFGFQSEERTLWEASEVYLKMSPFMHAHKIKQPLLLIHGEADSNSGTYTMQSERFYAALKGHGATTRLVLLPKESHAYKARESILHMLWEMTNWLDKYVKNKID